MKKVKYENVINAAGTLLFKRNCTDSEVLKINKLKLKQTPEQFERSSHPAHMRLTAIQSCSLTEHEADVQYARLKSWIETLDNGYKSEIEDILFPVFISLYRKLKNSGNVTGARSFYSRHKSNFFQVPEYIKMAEKFCLDTRSYFTLEFTQETYEGFINFMAKSDHLILQHVFNTTIEMNIIQHHIEKESLSDIPKAARPEASPTHGEEMQDFMDIASQMNKLPPSAPVLKMFTVDTGLRKMCSASISSCYTYLSCGFQDSSISVWNVKNLKPLEKPNPSGSLGSSCSLGLYHPCRPSGQPEPLSTSSGHSGPVYSTQFTPNNTHLLTASDDTTLRLWDLQSLESSVVYRGHTYPVWSADVFQQYFASGSQDRTAKLWTFDRTYPLRVFAGHTASVDCVSFHPNGMYVATGSADSSVRMWSVSEGNMVRILAGTPQRPGHKGTVLSTSFSPCGKYLASGGEDHRVIVWDVDTSSIVHDFRGHNDVVHCVSYVSDTFLAAYSADGNVRVWNVQSADPTASYTVPPPWKPVHLSRGFRHSVNVVGASD